MCMQDRVYGRLVSENVATLLLLGPSIATDKKDILIQICWVVIS